MLFIFTAGSQTIPCPQNLDFEQGSLNGWKYYTCSNIYSDTFILSGPVTSRHTLTAGTDTDFFGGFPIVAPAGGAYSLKLGNALSGAQAEAARYYIHVPAGVNNYSLIYRYAVVFENPGHPVSQQPKFTVNAFDSSTLLPVPCAQNTYISSAALPGFNLSSQGNQVYFKSWSTAILNLSGQAGKTIAVDFASYDCIQGGHFGYGYVDMSCGLFQVSTTNCSGGTNATLSAPAGFQSYEWRDSSLNTVVGTGQTISVTAPAFSTKYNVILTPYAGYGCSDTLSTWVNITGLILHPTSDTFLCPGNTLQLTAGALSSSQSIAYNWSPVSNLSCSTCANPVASPTANSKYYLTVTDGNGCVKTDSVGIQVGPILAGTALPATCYGGANGSAIVTATSGLAPYTYSWNTVPVQTTATATGLTAGTFTATVTDSRGCAQTATAIISQPAPLIATVTAGAPVSCYGNTNGTALLSGTGGSAPYTYSWNTTPIQVAALATGLSAGAYTATVTDSKGCTAAVNTLIAQPAPLAVSIAKTDVSCSGGFNGTAAAVIAGGTAPYVCLWNTAPVQSGPSAANLGPGTYTLTVTDSHGCTTSGAVTITAPAPLAATITMTDVPCFGSATGSGAVAVNGGTAPYAYSWNTTPFQTTANATNLVAGSYIATITDSKGCILTKSGTVAQPASMISSTVIKTDVSCHGGANGTASVNITGGATPYTYTWNTVPAQTSATAGNLSAGNYMATVTDSHGCAAIDTVNISQPLPLTATATPSNISCYGGSGGSASLNAGGGTPPYAISWNTTPAQTTNSITGLSAGTYIATATDAKGCVASTTALITQPAQPLSTMISNIVPASCFNTTNGSALAAATGGTPPYMYSWNAGPSLSTPVAAGLPAGAYSLLVTDTAGCTANASMTITQPVALTATATKSDVVCYGASDGTATLAPSGGTAPYSFAWNTAQVQTAATATGLAPGAYTCMITDGNGCTLSHLVQISQPAVPLAASITGLSSVSCFGGHNGGAAMTATGGWGGYSYSWNTVPAQTTAALLNVTAGNYIITVTDSKGCMITANTQVQEPPVLQITMQHIQKSCSDLATGSALAAVSGGTLPYSIMWDTPQPQTGFTGTQLAAGTYLVTATDAMGCFRTATAVVQAYPKNNIRTGPALSVCQGTQAELTASGAASYSWAPAASLSCPACAATFANPAVTTLYTVTGIDGNGCPDTAKELVTVIPKVPVYAGPDTKICIGDVATLEAIGGIAYQWSPAEGMDNNTSPGPRVNPAADTRYRVIITENECFKDTLYQSVHVLPRPTINVGPDFRGLPGSTVQLHAAASDAGTITWTPAESLSCAGCPDPVATLQHTITYSASVTNAAGCTAADDVTITVGCDGSSFFMANTFTPNGDGQNDRFYPQGRGISTASRFRVFDRWGELVYEADHIPVNDPAYGWDGTFRNVTLKPDVYIYIVESVCANGDPVVTKGDISLIR